MFWGGDGKQNLKPFARRCYGVSVKPQFDREKLEGFCRERGIARLELFGSARGENFRDSSDVDLLATLRSGARPTLLDWADMQEQLAELFGRPVDLVSRRAVERSRNRYRKHSILSTATPIYAEG
jgi:predicted nucleotidyltransferase